MPVRCERAKVICVRFMHVLARRSFHSGLEIAALKKIMEHYWIKKIMEHKERKKRDTDDIYNYLFIYYKCINKMKI